MKLITRLLTFVLLLIATAADAQDMATELRANGKIYVVVTVLATIFAGIIAFLIYLERKITRLERGLNKR